MKKRASVTLAGFIVFVIIPLFLLFSLNIDHNTGDEKLSIEPLEQPLNDDLEEPAGKPSFRFVVMSDCRGSVNGVNVKAVRKTMEQIKKLDPQPIFAFIPGDIVGGSKDFHKVRSMLETFKKEALAYYPMEFFKLGIGNHETHYGTTDAGEKAFSEVFIDMEVTEELEGYYKTVYYVDHENSRFIMLNTNHYKNNHMVDDTQLEWLEKVVKGDKRHYFVFFHEPAFPVGANLGSSLDQHPKQRDKLWKILDDAGVTMVFVGHDHCYNRRHINDAFGDYKNTIYQVTVGTFGAPPYPQYLSKTNVDVPPIPVYHFAVVDVEGDIVYVKALDLEGNILDEFSVKSITPAPTSP